MKWRNFEYNTAIHNASYMINEVDGINDFTPKDYFECFDEEAENRFLEKISKPHKYTLLHEYIEYNHEFGIDYIVDKVGYEEILETMINTIEYYDAEIPDESNFEYLSDEYERKQFYHEKVKEAYFTLTPMIVEETFSILYQNKRFLRNFNYSIRDLIVGMKKDDYTDFLKSDGVIKRASYINVWLKNGVFHRDKGRCQLCGKDLTRLINTDSKIHYDHIIPLKKGGHNDPTNFQLVCETCNTKKGDRNEDTNNLTSTFW